MRSNLLLPADLVTFTKEISFSFSFFLKKKKEMIFSEDKQM